MQNISKEMYFYSGNERHDQREFVWTMHKVQCHDISNIEKIVSPKNCIVMELKKKKHRSKISDH